MQPYASSQSRWLVTLLASGCGLVASATVLWLASRDSELTRQQAEILRIILALTGGGIGAVIPGFLDLNLNPAGKFALRAGGGLAVFALLYFWSPARWQAMPAEGVTASTPGAVSPNTISDIPAGTTQAK